ncbi:MAG TPA: sugar ABC transporter permease [Gaiellaceae bacterium]|nr:sugar ABC transporter permease [Gaiellaceae bacterium]
MEAPMVARRRRTFRSRLHRVDSKASPYLYISPFFILFGLFGLFPLGYTAWVALTDRTLLNPHAKYIGLDNFSALIHDSYFWNAVENTLAIFVISTVPQLAFALFLAHLLNTKLRARTFFRMFVLLPQVTSLVAVALIFTQLFSHDYGLINYVLGEFGIHKVNWEAGRFSSWVALSVMVTWRWAGYNALIYLAAMQGIPDELYEAAAIDGAKPWKQFRHVTIPLLRPTIIFTVIVSTIGGLQLFTEPYLFQPLKQGSTGGSARQYQTVVMYLYEKAFGSTQFDFGYAAAIGWALFLLIAVISLVNFLIVRRIRSADA